MLTAAELAQLHTDVGELLPDTCDVERVTETVSASGNTVEDWTTIVSATPCRLDPLNQQDSKGVVAAREATRTYFTLTVGWNVNIQESDRVIFGSETYELVQIFRQHSDRIVKRATVALIQGA